MSAANSQELEERTGWIFPPQLSKGNNRFKVTSENLLNSFPACSPQHCETITFCYFSCSPRGPLLKRVYWINTWDWTTEGNGLSQGSSRTAPLWCFRCLTWVNLNPWEEERPKENAGGKETLSWLDDTRKKGRMVDLNKLQSSTFLKVNNPDPYVCERDVRRKPTLALWPEESVSGVRVSEAEKEGKRSRLFSLAFHMFR